MDSTLTKEKRNMRIPYVPLRERRRKTRTVLDDVHSETGKDLGEKLGRDLEQLDRKKTDLGKRGSVVDWNGPHNSGSLRRITSPYNAWDSKNWKRS